VIDCATSVNQRGKIERYAREGKDTPRGAVIDSDGIERTDTEGILKDMVMGKCALTPLGGAGDAMAGYKGENISLIRIELFIAISLGRGLNCVRTKCISVHHFKSDDEMRSKKRNPHGT